MSTNDKYFPAIYSAHQAQAVVVRVIDFYYLGETTPEREDLKKGLRELFSNHVRQVSNLWTGRQIDPCSSKLVAYQTGSAPMFLFKEIAQRRIQKLLGRWLESGMGVNLLIYEVRSSFTSIEDEQSEPAVTYAWAFDNLRPENSGRDEVSGHARGGIEVNEVTYEISAIGTYRDDLKAALATAELLEAERQAELKARSQSQGALPSSPLSEVTDGAPATPAEVGSTGQVHRASNNNQARKKR